MKRNRCNSIKDICLIFLAICFFSYWWYICQTKPTPTNQYGLLSCLIFNSDAAALYQEIRCTGA